MLAAPTERKEGWTRNKLGSKQIRASCPANMLNKTEISWFPEKSILSSRLGLAKSHGLLVTVYELLPLVQNNVTNLRDKHEEL